ncbi:MAG: hypothetical protein F4138_08245 [Acidimicrobiia bacterium]|nr:hypothetical protein [Acidimicrobiia bacterium]MYC57506.1 hypothetical protein [Acidimicrobiia bacterium]MYG94946.1 hypothetical protein [Acidimicrobiia bacterium]MYI29780.1 hypothetical protein [Acidimicrobiia bacterium]
MVSKEVHDARAYGQAQGRTISRYLNALDQNKSKKGRQRSKEKMQARMSELPAQIAQAKPLRKVHLIQELMNLETELNQEHGTSEINAIESEFITIAAEYSARNGISYAAWREVGVQASVLKAAGLSRTSAND